jgi:hypothetical protein
MARPRKAQFDFDLLGRAVSIATQDFFTPGERRHLKRMVLDLVLLQLPGDPVPRLRRGLLADLQRAFRLADDDCGCHDPDIIADERAWLQRLHREVRARLRGRP